MLHCAMSVVIPTHNRAGRLRQTLAALALQRLPPSRFEVIVVADGCYDETAEMVPRLAPPYALHLVEQPGQGAAAARNAGAARARGALLVFLDDDIEASPTLLPAHHEAHGGGLPRVVVGALGTIVHHPNGFFAEELSAWWASMLARLHQPGHRATYRELLSGNLSIEASTFARLGGFDATLRCHEDYEFGARALDAGLALLLAPEAVGFHHEQTDLLRALARKVQEGIADVQIGQRHPALRPTLPLARIASTGGGALRQLRALTFEQPERAAALAARLLDLLPWLERLGRRRLWRLLLYTLLDCHYWQGVAAALHSRAELAAFLTAPPPPAEPPLDLDLREGLGAAARRLDTMRPTAARLYYGGEHIGEIPARPGSERLRGCHLVPALTTHCGPQFRATLALEAGASPAPEQVPRPMFFPRWLSRLS